MKKVFLLFILCCCFQNIIASEGTTTSQYLMKSVDSYLSIFEEVEKADPETLLVFDVDETLITFKDAVLRDYAKPMRESLAATYIQSMSKEEYHDYRSIIMQECEWQIVEEALPSLFKKIHEKELFVIGLTAMKHGPFGRVSSMQKWRKQQLEELNFQFRSPIALEEKEFSQFEKEPPYYYQGILCSGSHPKGAVLEAFLKELPHPPKKVIFCDDLQDRVASVVESMKKNKIAVTGYHYTGSKKLDRNPDPIVAKFQLTYLFKNKKWLSEKKSQEFIQQNPTLIHEYLSPL